MKPILILQNDSPVPPGTISSYFDQEKVNYSIVKTFEVEELPELTDYAAIISLGSTASANDYQKQPHLVRLFDYFQAVAKANHPFLGICFSSQLMAMALGAEVKRNPVKEVGCSEIKLSASGAADSLFDKFNPTPTVFQWHSDTFDLPEGAELLASSETCRNQAYRIGRIVGLQFHPEVDANIAESWSSSFKADLYMTNQTRPEMLSRYEPVAQELVELNYRLLENFIKNLTDSN